MIEKRLIQWILLQFVLMRSAEMSKICVCGHVSNQIDCEQSGFCIWQDGFCILNPGSIYNIQIWNQNLCKNFAKEDCIEQDQCGFHFGQCIDFEDCTIFDKNQCQDSSQRCVSDGTKCVEKLECNNYKTEIGCQNKNKMGKYCFWIYGIDQKCMDVTICEELPIFLSNHSMCKEGLDDCTIRDQGYGCMKQKESCTQYQQDFQCVESRSKIGHCFWDVKKRKCVEKVCENIPFSSDYECKQYLGECTSNGIHCIKRMQCSDVQNTFGCVTDAQGNKCEYHKNQCQIKSCSTAPDNYQNYQKCQDYDISFDCVTSENGGCKIRPQTCEGYVAEADCYSREQQNCEWFNHKCEYRQCHHAPMYYNHSDCKQYGNCIGRLNGGCQLTPQICDQILEEEFCEFNYNREMCFWLDGNCKLLECNKLKLPTYSNHKICQIASPFCTFHLDSQGCADYICENIFEIDYCQTDSNGSDCTLNQGCIEKKCQTAPQNYNTNQKCEEWLPECTVNVQVLQNFKISIGCTNKNYNCENAVEEQCYTTLTGLNCKWDIAQQKCINQVCVDANPNLYQTNEDCQKFLVSNGICIISSNGIGCQEWPNSCSLLIIQQQCDLNLQNGKQCYWTGSSCKIKECLDASIIIYTNNIECNSWLDYCIFNPILGGCMDRPSPMSCSSSPNNSMYDTHQECFAWNPQCTVISSFNSEGCEEKQINCSQFIRRRNCKTTLNGQKCYWDDKQQKCVNDNNDNTCDKRIREFMEIYLIKIVKTSHPILSEYCNYFYEQQCVINKYHQPCKWDLLNQICKNVDCRDNQTAQTEAECLKFKKYNECQLRININGTYGPGCELRPSECISVTNSIKCNLTLTINNDRCYFFNSQCRMIQPQNCEQITDSLSNELCQLYNSNCVLQQTGQGCYSINQCSDLSHNVCNQAIMKFNNKCNYYGVCNSDNQCSQKPNSYFGCGGRKTAKGQLCILQAYFYSDYYNSTTGYYEYRCENYFNSTSLSTSSSSISDRQKLCQNYSSSYGYDTSQQCVTISFCNQQNGDFQLCNSSITTSQQQCGYNFLSNTCVTRTCELLTYTNYAIITDEICYLWLYNCILGTTGCKTYTNDCNTIKLIQQCYSYSCFWQDGKCVSQINCQLNTTAISNRECLLTNVQFCRLNYTKGQGCSFFSCEVIKNQTICNSTTLVDGQNCIWTTSCQKKLCSQYTTQLDCENSYGYLSQVVTQCYWCGLNTTSCSNQKYCSSSSIISPISHQDCNNQNILSTINFSMSTKCIIKKLFCSEYKYQDACVRTIDGLECYWDNSVCRNICEMMYMFPFQPTDCYKMSPYCQLNSLNGCQFPSCALLSQEDCIIYASKCFWDGSECQTVDVCNKYLTSELCLNTNNSQDIPCFWDGIQCTEKTCQNKESPSQSKAECHDWLRNCQLDSFNNSCVEECTSADESYITHTQCESYNSNKSCTVKLDIIQCVDLLASCSLAKKTQCYVDKYGNRCYFSVSLNQCINLTCSNLDESYNTHQKCNLELKNCTVNQTLNGCQILDECTNYLIQEQCKINSQNVECEWIMSENRCTKKECSTAQLINYTAYGCQQYFGNSCSINKNLDKCEIAQKYCLGYSYEQCISDGQKNLSGISCFWNEERRTCLEKICINGPSVAISHIECMSYLSTCQKGGCRFKTCFDYNYALDQACASIFEDKRCATNGYRCVFRQNCEDVNIIDACTFDINLNPCVWIDDKCFTKTCQTALISINNYEDCNSYLSYCTVKQDGGCTKKQHCQDYQFKEACYVDSDYGECFWDNYLNECFSNSCIDFCGNGIVMSKDEQCDDGNYLPYDGCYKCQFQCPQGCTVCNGNLCQECETYGWVQINGICKSVCGDGYVVGNEFCDDGNNIEFDGCYLCSYSCHQMCLDCFQGQCILCEQGYVENGSQCHSICGDGYNVQLLEQCDDGNLINNDGCNDKCMVEQNWKCYEENHISNCKYSILPKIQLKKISKIDTGIQEFKLSFSEPVSLKNNLYKMIVIEILSQQTILYDIEIKPILAISNQIADVSYKILVDFKSSMSNTVLKVNILCDNIVNYENNTLFQQEAKLDLKPAYKISDTQESYILKAVKMSKILQYIIFVVVGIAFFSGNLEILWNLLDMFQQLSYMKYHNILFPQILLIYFEIFNIGSLSPIIDNFQIDQFIENYFDFQYPLIQTKWKFEEYQINCQFLQNFSSLITMFIFGFAYFLFSCFLYKLLNLTKYYNLPSMVNKQKFPFFFKVAKSMFSIQRFARKYYQYFIYSGLIRIYSSNFYELIFASLLQITNFNTDNTQNTIISNISLGILIFNLFFSFFIYFYLQKKSKVSKNLKVLVEGINYKAHRTSKQYFIIQLMKKTLFMINLVAFQGLGAIQSIITACLSGVFSCYIYISRPFENKFENIKLLIIEILIILNAIIFSIYEIIKFDPDKLTAEIFGWINVSLFTLILISTLIIDIYQQLRKYSNLIIAKVKTCLNIPKKTIQQPIIINWNY
ncbi:unnamed protein product [Paramecium sonneborni]|uniref:Uncharacterized protein n=1 Tax=Paramecium sonneborni TaxID=65129 RepID=A0A8S1PYR1_9CILI|nr:unnamed protein product [Paramecium sonneborni]